MGLKLYLGRKTFEIPVRRYLVLEIPIWSLYLEKYNHASTLFYKGKTSAAT